MKTLELPPQIEELYKLNDFINEIIGKPDFQVDLILEEVFVNIANYAYAPGTGRAVIRAELSDDPKAIYISFADRGMKYDPLAKEDPDVTLPAEERPTGGLGVFLVKKLMDEVSYEYSDGRNILKLKKLL